MYGIYIEKDEAVEIIISVLSISLAFALVFAGIDGMVAYPKEFLVFMAPLLVTVGSGFILHEMAHKLVAMFYGARARFKMWTTGLLVMLVTSIFGFLFAAPGAVYIYSSDITRRENGIISLVGPITNLALVGVFIALEIFLPVNQYFSFLTGDLGGFGISNGMLRVWQFGAAINLMLALFNMIPAFPLDGSKVFDWSKMIWIGTVFVLLAIGMVIIDPAIVISWGIMLLIFTALSGVIFGGSNARRRGSS